MYREMRMTVIAALMVLSAAAAHGQTSADTLITVKEPRVVTVEKTDGSTTVTIKGSADDDFFNYRYSVSADTVGDMPVINLPFASYGGKSDGGSRAVYEYDCFRGVYAGAAIPVSGPDVIRTAFEVGVFQLAGLRVRRNRSDFSVGVGFGYRRTGFGSGMLAEKSGDALILSPTPEGASDASSSISSWAIHVPLLYTQRIYRSLGFSLGVVANFNFHTTASSEYRTGDTKYSWSVKGLHQRMLTPDLILTVGSVNNAGVYVKWSPMKPFKSKYGPGWNTVSVGLSLAF